MNSYAAEGWRVVEGVLAASVGKIIKAKIVMIAERED